MNVRIQKLNTIFLIGMSGGVISAIFPRLFTSLALADSQIDVQLLSPGFWIVALGFALVIGISMIWLYSESKETKKNLFLAALAMPAVLSGAINMSNATSTAQATLSALESDQRDLLQQLEDAYGFEEITPIFDSEDEYESVEIPVAWSFDPIGLLGISSAVAETTQITGPSTSARSLWNPTVSFVPKDSLSGYLVALGMSSDLDEILGLHRTYTDEGIQGLQVAEFSAGRYYLVTSDSQSRADAVLTAIDLKNRGAHLKPQLVKLPTKN